MLAALSKSGTFDSSSSQGVGLVSDYQSREAFWVPQSSRSNIPLPLYPYVTSDYFTEGVFKSQIISELQEGLDEVDCKRSPSELLASISANLSLRVSELAEVLKVTRPAIYSWMSSDPSLREENRKRLFSIAQIASDWSKFSNLPVGTAVRRSTLSSKSLLDLLKEDKIDREAIAELLKELADLISEEADKKKKKSVAERAKGLGIDLSKVKMSDVDYDVLTRKPFAEE